MSQAIQSMFDSIAGRYDALNHLLSAGRDVAWRRRSARLLPRLEGSARVLDLCGGTGDFTLALRRGGFAGEAVLGDFAEQMLRRSKPKNLRAAPVALDALNLPFRAPAFDAVVCGFGMRNLDDLEAGVRAVHAALKPGGAFLTLEFFRPANPFTRLFYGVLAPLFIPLLGWAMGSKRDAYEYLVRSVRRFRSAEEYAALCRAAGFTGVRVQAQDGGIAHAVVALKAPREP
jgi:demethylmenaquinone methyltransferase/2-methoxy-6-polyprenyl-1,4-benzoquinol methylase